MKDLSNDVEYMKEYLRQALKMESHVYVWEEALDAADNKRTANAQSQMALESAIKDASVRISQLNSDELQHELSVEKARTAIKSYSLKKYVSLLAVAVFIPISLVLLKNNDKAIFELLLVLFLECSIAAFVFFIIFNIKQGNLEGVISKPYNVEIKNKKVKAIEDAISKNKNTLQTVKQELQRIAKDKSKISEKLAEANDALTKIYSSNVLPVKYRNFASVATLYGYLENRRCTTIAGHGGIYDTYEYDQQLGAINDNLNEIKYAVYQIYEAQYYLYDELTKANNHLNDIKRELGTISQNSERAADNSAIGAEASRQSADMLNWWNWTRKY